MVLQLFVDLDGVLADFDKRVRELTGRHPSDLPPQVMWSRIAKTPDFYNSLDWMADGGILWEGVKPWKPTILTGLPRGSWAEGQKREWCRRHLGENIRVITCMSKEKAEKAWESTQGLGLHVLIDDRLSLKGPWEAKGGRFIHHSSASQSLEILSSLGEQP